MNATQYPSQGYASTKEVVEQLEQMIAEAKAETAGIKPNPTQPCMDAVIYRFPGLKKSG